MKIAWLPAALRNRAHQIAYVAERNVQAAIALGDAIEAAVSQIARFPRSGRTGRVRGTRERVVRGTPLIIVYRIERDAIVVLRLLHGAQRWPPSLRKR